MKFITGISLLAAVTISSISYAQRLPHRVEVINRNRCGLWGENCRDSWNDRWERREHRSWDTNDPYWEYCMLNSWDQMCWN